MSSDVQRLQKHINRELLKCAMHPCIRIRNPSKVDAELLSKIMAFLNALSTEPDASSDTVRYALAVTLTMGQRSFVIGLAKQKSELPVVQVAILLAKLTLPSLVHSDAHQVSKRTRYIESLVTWLNQQESRVHSDEIVALCCLLRDPDCLISFITQLAAHLQVGPDFADDDSNKVASTNKADMGPISRSMCVIITHCLQFMDSTHLQLELIFSDFLSFQDDRVFEAYKRLIMLASYDIALHDKPSDKEVCIRLYDLALRMQRYFEAAFWGQYVPDNEGKFVQVRQGLLANGNGDRLSVVIDALFDIATIECLSATTAEMGMHEACKALVERMQGVRHSCPVKDIMVYNEEKNDAWNLGVARVREATTTRHSVLAEANE